MHELFGTTVYFTDALLYGYLLVYLPLTIVVTAVVYVFVVRWIPLISIRAVTILILFLTLSAIPWWDVYRIGIEATRLCEERGGLHIYKTVEAEGFLGSSNIKRWSKYGFSYVESGGDNNKNRWTMQQGEAVNEKIHEYSSRYVSKTAEDHVVINNHISRSSHHVVNRHTGEVLGELVKFSIHPSRFDSIVLNLLGGSKVWLCGNEAPQGKGSYSSGERKYLYGYADVVEATLKPIKPYEGESK